MFLGAASLPGKLTLVVREERGGSAQGWDAAPGRGHGAIARDFVFRGNLTAYKLSNYHENEVRLAEPADNSN